MQLKINSIFVNNKLSVCLVFFMLNVINLFGNDIEIKPVVKNMEFMSDSLLLQYGDYYLNNNKSDSALLCFSLIYDQNKFSGNKNELKVVGRALNKAFGIYFNNCDYRNSLQVLMRSLDICEKIGYDDYIGKVYNNIGNLYCVCGEFDFADKYFKLAYKQKGDAAYKASVLNNMGVAFIEKAKFDSALLYLLRAYDLRVSINDTTLYDQWNNIGFVNFKLKNYDEALRFYDLALKNARIFRKDEKISKILSNKAKLFLEIFKYDSASYYLGKSNEISLKGGFLDLTADNFLLMSQLEEKSGSKSKALEYYKKYIQMHDSLFSVSKYTIINQLESIKNISKVEDRVRELLEQQKFEKDRAKMNSRIYQIIIGSLIVIVVLLLITFRKNHNLREAYQKLVKRSVEIAKSEELTKQHIKHCEQQIKDKDRLISQLNLNKNIEDLSGSSDVRLNLNENPENEDSIKYKNSSLSDENKRSLLYAIEDIMQNSVVYFDPEFSLEKLADMVNSNSNYVSQIINDTFGKNFRLYVNEYRIKESCRIMSDPSNYRYSLETISAMVGFKSKSTFNAIFKKIVGVTPSYYLRSIQSNDY